MLILSNQQSQKLRGGNIWHFSLNVVWNHFFVTFLQPGLFLFIPNQPEQHSTIPEITHQASRLFDFMERAIGWVSITSASVTAGQHVFRYKACRVWLSGRPTRRQEPCRGANAVIVTARVQTCCFMPAAHQNRQRCSRSASCLNYSGITGGSGVPPSIQSGCNSSGLGGLH